jgi:hypothetical protein
MRVSEVLSPGQIGMLVVGYVLLGALAYLYLASGLLVPAPWLWGLWTIGVVLIGLSITWWRRPLLVLALPFVGTLIWLAYVQGPAPSSTGPPDPRG